ncbi:hypothetical protein ACLUWG_01755 [Bifidobacterium apri]|uniref:hypothetical protein n=1 Tax=Bifidobacterium apri TaxID=1769423 RepID=UPI003995B10A
MPSVQPRVVCPWLIRTLSEALAGITMMICGNHVAAAVVVVTEVAAVAAVLREDSSAQWRLESA